MPEGNWVITSSWGHSQDIPPLANHFLLLSGNSLEAHNLPTPLPLPTDHHQSFSPPNPYPGALLRALWDSSYPKAKALYLTQIFFLFICKIHFNSLLSLLLCVLPKILSQASWNSNVSICWCLEWKPKGFPLSNYPWKKKLRLHACSETCWLFWTSCPTEGLWWGLSSTPRILAFRVVASSLCIDAAMGECHLKSSFKQLELHRKITILPGLQLCNPNWGLICLPLSCFTFEVTFSFWKKLSLFFLIKCVLIYIFLFCKN